MTYTVTEKTRQAWENQFKKFEMSETNDTYFNSFRDSKYPEWQTEPKQKASWLQYKSRVGNFLDSINKDVFTLSLVEIKSYIKQKPNTENHIRGFLIFCLKEDIKGCKEKARKELLFWLLGV